MATQYEIELQKQLERSRNNPVDEYSAGLLDLARFNAQQRFIQQENATRLEGQKEILTQTQIAEAEENKKRFQQQKELQTTLLKSQAEIQEARDKAEAARQEARDVAAEIRLDKREKAAGERQIELLTATADRYEKQAIAAEKRNQETIEGSIKRAEIAAAAQVEAAEKRAKAAENNRVMDRFQSFGIVKEKNESDDDYIARAQKEFKSNLAGQLVNTYNTIQATSKQIEDLTAASVRNYQRRLAEAAWKSARGLIPEPQQGILDKMDPITREARIAGLPDKLRNAKTQYDLALGKARETIPDVDTTTQAKLEGLRGSLEQLNKVQALRLNSIEYAPAIEEYLKRINPEGSPPPGAGLVPPPAGSGTNPASGLAFGKAATTSPASGLAPGAGTGAGAPVAAVSPDAGVDPAIAARVKRREDEAALLGPTAAEAMPLGERIRSRGLVPTALDYLDLSPGEPAASSPNIPRRLASVGQLLFGRNQYPDWMMDAAYPDRAPAAAVRPAPVTAQPEISAPAPFLFRTPMGASPGVASAPAEIPFVGPRLAPVPLESAPSPAVFPPSAMFPVGGIGRAPVVAPEIMDARGLRAARVKQAIRLKYPDLERLMNLDRIPLEDLERLYQEREVQRMGPPLITPLEPVVPMELRF